MQLNQEQKRIINAKPNGHTLLKGVAGSGKTTIAVTRLPFLLHNYCFDVDDRILLVTYNKTLVNYFKYLKGCQRDRVFDKIKYGISGILITRPFDMDYKSICNCFLS
ncbi:MAG: UvrD-helicase domain-containing protein [Syntrophomonas sp.]